MRRGKKWYGALSIPCIRLTRRFCQFYVCFRILWTFFTPSAALECIRRRGENHPISEDASFSTRLESSTASIITFARRKAGYVDFSNIFVDICEKKKMVICLTFFPGIDLSKEPFLRSVNVENSMTFFRTRKINGARPQHAILAKIFSSPIPRGMVVKISFESIFTFFFEADLAKI